MVKAVLGAAGLLAVLAAQSAHAADYIPRPELDFIPAPVSNWTGVYGGLHLGWGNADRASVLLDPRTSFYNAQINAGDMQVETDTGARGFVGGGQIGYNWQLRHALVGVEGDVAWSDINRDVSASTSFGTTRVNTAASVDINWYGSLRLRAGFASDRALLYVTGGLAMGGVDGSYSASFPELGNSVGGSSSGTNWGWTVGAGAAAKVTHNISIQAEVFYFDLGQVDYVATGSGAASGHDIDISTEVSGWLARLGFNYHL